MKTLFLAISIFTFGFGYSQINADTSNKNPNYDPILAEKLGSDSYGMKSYYFVILKTGSNDTKDKKYINECFVGHLKNIQRLVDENKLIVAGPLGKNSLNYRGIFILNNISTLEEAKAILETDPAIKSKLLDYELMDWYGSAALPLYLLESEKIWKEKP